MCAILYSVQFVLYDYRRTIVMKKFISILVITIIVLSALAFTACGGGGSSDEDLANSKYVGTWTNTSISFGEASGELDDEFTIVLNDDGTGKIVSGDETWDFTWKLTSDGFKTDGDMKMTFTDDGDNIKSTILGADLVFEKQE